MVILGIIDSKPSAAAVMVNGEVVAAIAEERLSRWKMAKGMPLQAIGAVLEIGGISAESITHVAIPHRVKIYEPEPMPWSGWFDNDTIARTRFNRLSSLLAPTLGTYPLAWQAHHHLKAFVARPRLTQLPALLRTRYHITAPVTFYDHHYCHATSTYFNSNFDEALVITLDGGGDGLSGSVYVGKQGKLTRLAAVDSFNSLGNFYSYITELCGFKAEKHEGKITGLAAIGEPRYADILRQFIGYDGRGNIAYHVPMFHRSALDIIGAKLPHNFDRADLAASVQLVFEEIGSAFIEHWLTRTGQRQVAVAGGVFANVKFNQRVHALPHVDSLFVYPGMSDDGLAVGGTWAAWAETGVLPKRLPHMYLGPCYSDASIETAINAMGLSGVYMKDAPSEIADLLAKGHVVARFTGRMEYGPRALGHRSILYQTTDVSVNKWLNERLNRTEFMPFAPATLLEKAGECYVGWENSADSARFMTITFDCTPTMKTQSPGVVHVDGTARPQLVDATTAPDFHQILTAYYTLTGIPSLINTSFNLHGEPIVCTPADALRSFQQGHLDYLAIGNWLVQHKNRSCHND